MTAYDLRAAAIPSWRTMRLIGSIHLQNESDGGALVIDDRTLMAAHINEAAHVLLRALHRPCTQDDLVTRLASAANCDIDDAVVPVAELVVELASFGWIEFQSDVADAVQSQSVDGDR